MPQIGVLTVEIHIPQANSLKQKRQVIRSLKDRLHAKFNVSVAEIDHLDKWQLARLAIVMASNDHKLIESALEKVQLFIESEIAGSALVVRREISFR